MIVIKSDWIDSTQMERQRRLPAPGVEEALSSMLWTPYPRTPSDTSDDDDDTTGVPIGTHKRPHDRSAAASTTTATTPTTTTNRFARLTRPLSFMDKRKSTGTFAGADAHLYPEPIRYYGVGCQPTDQHQLYQYQAQSAVAGPAAFAPEDRAGRHAAAAAGPARCGGLYQQQRRSAQLPSYELVEQERRLHHSLNSITAAAAQLPTAAVADAAAGAGIYFIAPYGRAAVPGSGSVSVGTGAGTMLVNSFTDDFAQYQVSVRTPW